MSEPVTREEFRREIDRLDRRFDTFEARVERNFSTFLDAILDRMDARFEAQEKRYDQRFAAIDQRFAAIDQRFESMEKWFGTRIDELTIDLARHANAIQENVAQQIRVLDDKYKDLPGRVAALEAAQPRRRPRKRAR